MQTCGLRWNFYQSTPNEVMSSTGAVNLPKRVL